MSNLVDVIVDNFPPVSGLDIPLGSTISVTFNILMNVSGLQNSLFVEGPDTDQFVGPGLLEQQFPQNISQGALDDFLRSPGYQGIVQGTWSSTTVPIPPSNTTSGTEIIFTPRQPLAPSTTYIVHIVQTDDAYGNVVSGYVDWSFETGTGSIIQLPNTISTSVLAQAFRSPGLSPAAVNLLQVVSTTPCDHSVQNDEHLQEIDVVFDKEIDPASVNPDMISIQAIPLTSHPNVNVNAQGAIAFNVTVSGNILKLSI